MNLLRRPPSGGRSLGRLFRNGGGSGRIHPKIPYIEAGAFVPHHLRNGIFPRRESLPQRIPENALRDVPTLHRYRIAFFTRHVEYLIEILHMASVLLRFCTDQNELRLAAAGHANVELRMAL